MKCNITFSHVILLALASVPNGIINGTILFVRWKILTQRGDMTFCSWDVISTAIVNGTVAFVLFRPFKQHATWIFSQVVSLIPASESCDADSTINGTTAFVRSLGQDDQSKVWHNIWSCNTLVQVLVDNSSVGTSTSIIWCHHQWLHCVNYDDQMIKMRYNLIDHLVVYN